MEKTLLVTLADQNYLEQAKQLFSSVYWNSGWKGDYMLLAHDIPDDKLGWFKEKGILIYHCRPLAAGKSVFGIRHHPATVFSKGYLFGRYFKKWDKIIFLDSDIIVRASLDRLATVDGFAAPDASPIVLKTEFYKGNAAVLSTLKKEYWLSGRAFNTGVFAFDTSLITDDLFDSFISLIEKYQSVSSFGEEGLLNLLFYKRWTMLPFLYNAYPEPVCYHYRLLPGDLQSIIIHFVASEKPWSVSSPFHKEWLDNRGRAELINLAHRKEAIKNWTEAGVQKYILMLKKRRRVPLAKRKSPAFFAGELDPRKGGDAVTSDDEVLQKCIVVISSIPTHPQNAGNRARIFNLLTNIRSLGYRIHFVYDDKERGSHHVRTKPDVKAMSRAWDGFAYVYRRPMSLRGFIMVLKRSSVRTMGRVGLSLRRKWPSLYAALKPFFPDRPSRPTQTNGLAPASIDAWYNHDVSQALQSLTSRRYDAVIAEYVFMSRALGTFAGDTLKIIDTHDVFSNREEKYALAGVKHEFFSTTAAEESKGLGRADRIIAIQDHEREILQTITDRPVYTVGHTVALVANPTRRPRMRVLCIGSASEANIHGVDNFIKNVLHHLRSQIPGFELVVAGKVCDAVADAAGCVKLGEIQDLDRIYQEADIVINPVNVGTGLKIKSIEALGRGKPLVTTLVGAEGLEDAIGGGVVIVYGPEDYIAIISKLVSDPSAYQKASQAAYDFAAAYNAKTILQLKNVLRK
jgi:glycosyltransferase involved in cell wall biosynthesis